MNILMFTPVITSSAIGQRACFLAEALCTQGHEVTLIRTEVRSLWGAPLCVSDKAYCNWMEDKKIIRALQKADITIYHLGNDFNLHAGVLEWAPRVPGVVCLHEGFLDHLFTEWSKVRGVLMYSADGVDQVLRVCPGPVEVLALPDDNEVERWIEFLSRVLQVAPIIDMGMYFNQVLSTWKADANLNLDATSIQLLSIFEPEL